LMPQRSFCFDPCSRRRLSRSAWSSPSRATICRSMSTTAFTISPNIAAAIRLNSSSEMVSVIMFIGGSLSNQRLNCRS